MERPSGERLGFTLHFQLASVNTAEKRLAYFFGLGQNRLGSYGAKQEEEEEGEEERLVSIVYW